MNAAYRLCLFIPACLFASLLVPATDEARAEYPAEAAERSLEQQLAAPPPEFRVVRISSGSALTKKNLPDLLKEQHAGGVECC
jgi:hypothetical protein